MAFTYTDVISEIKTLLSSNWTKTNTDNTTPEFEYIYDKKRIDSFWNGDWVLFQNLNTVETNPYLGNGVRFRTYRIKLDLRSDYDEDDDSTTGREHLFNMDKELRRIIDTNYSYNFTTGFGLVTISEPSDLSDGKKRLWRYVYTLEIKKYVEAVS